jgi:hypothetical protein
MQLRQPACGVSLPEGRFQEEWLQPADPQSPQLLSEYQSAQQKSRLSHLPALRRAYIQLN